MKDFFGQELSIGDRVAFEQPKYRNLVLGVIVSFTPKQVRLLWNNPQYSTTAKHTAPDGTMWSDTFIALPDAVIRKPKKDND